jgi:hypothetical protein
MTCDRIEQTGIAKESARKNPCHECPFRTGGPVGWTGAAAPEEFAASILGDERMPCHKTIDYEDPQWKARWSAGETGQLCAGALVMTANIAKRSRAPDRPVYQSDRVGVYPTLPAMIDAHRSSRVRSWVVPDHAPSIAAVRARLMMPALDVIRPPSVADEGSHITACAYPDCEERVTPDDHCAGCGFHVCDRHSTNVSLMGHGHDVSEHWADAETDEG